MDKQLTHCDFIVYGEGLASMDFNGKSDPYIVIKVPTTVLMKRNIFEYEKDVAITENFPSTHTSRKNSQGSFVFHDDPSHAKEEHTHLLLCVFCRSFRKLDKASKIGPFYFNYVHTL
eukprot:Phypoly_transcript_26569.p1 GENE.Phypoly_transcript_26569~~Phypoly_transcript_26569.p1  ORF type:complete len:117 (+),score=9.19 Phypoly_transcript_26569:116-466(+)